MASHVICGACIGTNQTGKLVLGAMEWEEQATIDPPTLETTTCPQAKDAFYNIRCGGMNDEVTGQDQVSCPRY
jgi:hypothetical protein